MATRLRAKFKKRIRDRATAFKKGETPARHKIAKARSKKHLKRALHPMT